MFKQYRKIEMGEFICIGADCSQGGADSNCAQFLSKNEMDIPLIYHSQGVAAQMTPYIFNMAERLQEITGIAPMIAIERNNGGASEMERLRVLNRNNKYRLFIMPDIGKKENKTTDKLGYDTTVISRPILVGDLKNVIDIKGITIYDEETIQELFWFIMNNQGKPEAMKGKHDDRVISLAIANQINQYIPMPVPAYAFPKTDVGNKNWSLDFQQDNSFQQDQADWSFG